ncbi:MAG: CoA transferase [Acidobacteriia bacterium]|nr:CoA transferase [Terriglobia bacterium]
MKENNEAPLAGLLVVDLTRAVAGPFATMLLGDMGARVIKVEEEGTGDETRQWGPPFVEGISTYFLSMNRNKESVALNLKREPGRSLLAAMAAKADVVIENFRPGVMERLGFGYEALSGRNPRLVYASISGFGQTGPDRLRPGYDLVLQAMSGLMDVSRAEGEAPVKVAFPVADILSGLFAGQAIMTALYSRERTGKGRYIDVSLMEGMLCAMSSLAETFLATGKQPQRVGTAQANIVPYQMFHCADGALVCGAPNERLWQRFCSAIGRPEWLLEERYRGNGARTSRRKELVAAIEDVLRGGTVAEWLARFEENQIPCGPVLDMEHALGHRQVQARGTIVESPHAKLGTVRSVGNPMRMSGFTPAYTAAPDLGADTERLRKEFLRS